MRATQNDYYDTLEQIFVIVGERTPHINIHQQIFGVLGINKILNQNVSQFLFYHTVQEYISNLVDMKKIEFEFENGRL